MSQADAPGPNGTAGSRGAAAPSAAGTGVAVAGQGPAAAALTLLVVDDEPDMLDVLRLFAADALPHAHVLGATSGTEALRVLAGQRVDIILCDYRMADLDGIEVLRQSVGLAPGARRVLMTAFADSSLPSRAAKVVPLDGFFEKAADPRRLRSQLAGLAVAASA